MNRSMALPAPTIRDRILDPAWVTWDKSRSLAEELFGLPVSDAYLLGLDRPLLVDTSYWQLVVNTDVLAANGVLGIIARAGISWGYTDPYFKATYDKAGQSEIYRSSYHVIYTDQPILPQADSWYSMHPERDIWPRWIDLEVNRGDSNYSKAAAVMQMSDICLSRDGVRPGIYSRYALVDSWLADLSDDELNSHYFWLAQYLFDRTKEHPGPPTLPARVGADRVVMHQTADRVPKFAGSVTGSATLDRDRWTQGNGIEMHNWIAEQWGGGIPLTHEEEHDILWREAAAHGWDLSP